MTRNKEWKGKTGGGNFGQRCLFFYFKHGSIALIYAIVGMVILLYLAINYKATKNIYRYFRSRQQYSVCKSIVSTYRNHFLFGKTVIDKFALFAGRKNDFILERVGQEEYDRVVKDQEKGAIIVNSHVGSAEIAGYFFSQKIKKLYAIVFGGESPEMQKQRARILEENNVSMIPVTDPFSHIFAVNNALKNADLVSMAGDRVYEGSKNLTVQFLGAPAEFPTSAFQLAVKLQVPMLALFVMQNGYKKYKCFVYSLEVADFESFSKQKQVELLMQEYASKLEGILQEYPLQWYNFYDFWKIKNNPTGTN